MYTNSVVLQETLSIYKKYIYMYICMYNYNYIFLKFTMYIAVDLF